MKKLGKVVPTQLAVFPATTRSNAVTTAPTLTAARRTRRFVMRAPRA